LTIGHRQCPRLGSQPSELSDLVDPASLAYPPTEVAHRRPLNRIEGMVGGLTAAILLAFLFVSAVVTYRLVVNEEPGAAAPVAQELPPAPTQVAVAATVTALPTQVVSVATATLPSVQPGTTPLPAADATWTVVPTPVPEPVTATAVPNVRIPATSPPTRLVIPKIGLDVAVKPVGFRTVGRASNVRTVWGDLPNVGAFHKTSAYPGHIGNTVINGHRDIKGSVFRRLDRVEVGDEIVLYVGEDAYPYVVSQTLVVPETFASAEQRAENLRLIGYMPEERLTLITCTPVGLATHRLLVIAKPATPTSPDMPAAGSAPGP
jgi:LPXTG-site transpeptidase (sortase) family protein